MAGIDRLLLITGYGVRMLTQSKGGDRRRALMHNLMLLIGTGGAQSTDVLPHYIGSEPTSWVDVADVAAVAAHVLRDPEPHAGRSYGLGTEWLTMAEIAALLSEITGRPWRDDPRHPDRFLEAVVAAGADPVYME